MAKIKISESLIALALAVGSAGPMVADAADVRGILKTGFDFGGDNIVTVPFTDGSTRTLKGNQGFYVGGGAAIINEAGNWELDVTLAYKLALIHATNGDLTWTRWPLEALVFYRFQHVRLGGGLAYHISPKLEGSGVANNLDIDFKDALGAVLQADWRITPTISVGLRYTFLEYDAKAPFTGSAKSDGPGVTFSWNF
jgi:hypothetical protein